ncbi:deoxyguanosinetriphosphate triphosphohydrolase family protein [Raineyella fluvialis]|uniref:DNTP triphosphohydrolase n=1 Tax=Raineyella fluvialis TaxID=2662261 RepID=A0A5Q2F9P5_9ACTN|nr:dNTP triphosphohydrolase [Raineyella fluvialis]QGF23622.1 dNTP triphosphohydrolase [Raineyella fluvialis]
MSTRTDRARTEDGVARPLAAGTNSEYRVDLERIRFSPSFSRLAEVTQVVSAGTTGGIVHNRLTHTIKVTAVARAIAVRLEEGAAPERIEALGGLNHVVAQAGAGAHDLGHPPFGHLGEQELDRQARTRFGLNDGFEGNAQTFRVLTELETHGPGDEGLNLTTAVRASVLKYPWGRHHWPDPHPRTWARQPRGARPDASGGSYKFNAYVPDLDELIAVRKAFPDLRPDLQTLDCAVMDLADDVAYSLHDLDDFHRAGVLQFSAVSSEFRTWAQQRDELTLLPDERLAALTRAPGIGLEGLRRRLAARDAWIFDDDAYLEAVLRVGKEFVEGVLAIPYDGSMAADRSLSGFTSTWIDDLVASVRLVDDPPVRGSSVELSAGAWHEVQVLKFIHQYFVLHRPDLALMQRGQANVIRQIVEAFDDWLGDRLDATRAPRRLLDLVETATEGYRRVARRHPGWLDGMTSREDVLRMGRGRGIIDFVAAMTDHQAEATAARLRGGSGLLWGGGSV